MKIRIILALCAALILGSFANASAYTINYTQLTEGLSSVTNSTDGWTATSSPGNFQYKTNDGNLNSTGVGISGNTAGEIDIREYLTFTFTTAQYISSIRLSMLYAGLVSGAFGDPNEKAQLTVTDIYGEQYIYTLQATGASTCVWTGSGSASSFTNDADSESGAAVWLLINPFEFAITSLSFTALDAQVPGRCFDSNSDYAFQSLTTSSVPEPVTSLLLGFGLLGLAGARRAFSK
jgi:hypothetical protein